MALYANAGVVVVGALRPDCYLNKLNGGNQMGNCINLKKLAGRRYRLGYDESYYAERGRGARADDPWLLTMPCRLGHIFPWGSETLAASTNSRGRTAGNLTKLGSTTVVQDGDDGVTVTFPVERFAEVARLMKPRRRRRMSPESRRAAVERLARYRFSAAAQAPEIERKSTRGTQDEVLPVVAPKRGFWAANCT